MNGVATITAHDGGQADAALVQRFGQSQTTGERTAVFADVVRQHRHAVLSSCAEGTCGTCETAVLSGLPDHRDSVLTDEEREAGDCMMICVSRSCTARLVLDL